jgi:hypothetical protein
VSEYETALKRYEYRQGCCEHNLNPNSGYCVLCRVSAERDVAHLAGLAQGRAEERERIVAMVRGLRQVDLTNGEIADEIARLTPPEQTDG